MSIFKDSRPRTLLRGESLKLIIAAAIYFLAFWFAPAAFASSTVVINEFSSQTSTDWVELYNTSNEQVNLNNYVLKDNTTSGNPKSTSCLLAPHGFVALDWGTSLNKNGDTIFLKLGDEILECISFGDGADGSCPGETGPTLANPSADQVGARMPDGGAWQLTTVSTKDAPNDGAPKPASAVCSTPTPTSSPTPTPTPEPTPKPTSIPKPTATATPVPTGIPTSVPTTTSVLSPTDNNSSPQVLAEADENQEPEVNLDIIDLTATSESKTSSSPSSQSEKSGGTNLPGGGLPLIWSEFKSKKGIISK